jgi:hypothetical protein
MTFNSIKKQLLSGPFLVGSLVFILVICAIALFVRRNSIHIPFFESFDNQNETCGGYTDEQSYHGPTPSEPLGFNETNQELQDNHEKANAVDIPKDCFPHEQLNPADLLPSEANSKWAQSNPAGQGSLGDKNFLNAGFHVGINTVGQSMRNSNLQLRSEPPNPQSKVSPWMQATIDPDLNRKPLEIGPDDGN